MAQRDGAEIPPYDASPTDAVHGGASGAEAKETNGKPSLTALSTEAGSFTDRVRRGLRSPVGQEVRAEVREKMQKEEAPSVFGLAKRSNLTAAERQRILDTR